MNTSHTEDHSIPPKGVEIIGDLPPGTPWWDAEVLAVRVFTYPWYIWPFLLGSIFLPFLAPLWVLKYIRPAEFLVAVVEQGFAPSFLENVFTALLVAFIVFAGVITIGAVISIFGLVSAVILNKHDLVLFGLKAKWTPFDHYWSRRLPFLKTPNLVFDLHSAACRPFKWVTGTSGKNEKGIRDYTFHADAGADVVGIEIAGGDYREEQDYPMYIAVGSGREAKLALALLNYRIARAKGKNPPPPEFL